MTELAEIEAQLKEPFPLEEIDLLPKGVKEGRPTCMALPYADPRAYEDRLNALAHGEWQTPTPVALAVGSKLIVFVTVIICGISHTDVGEASPGENQGTEAWAQGFKRACSQFGLGRYLYDLEKEWVAYSAEKKQIDLSRAEKNALARKMYQKAGIGLPGTSLPPVPGKPVQPQPKPVVATVAPKPIEAAKPTIEDGIKDATMLPEKARIVTSRLTNELGLFELKRFKVFLALSPEQNLYDPRLWEGTDGEALMKKAVENLEKWLKPHPERTKWMNQEVLPEQLAAILNTVHEEDGEAKFRLARKQNPASVQSIFMELLAGDFEAGKVDQGWEKAHKAATKQMGRIRDLDASMHGKRMSTFTAGEADRYLSYIEGGTFDDQGLFQVEIPSGFQYQAPGKAA